VDLFDLRKWGGFAKAGGDLIRPALINQVLIDSRAVSTTTSLFAALPGTKTDGHMFVPYASKSGAGYALVKNDYASSFPLQNTQLLKVDDPLLALQEIAQVYRCELPAKIIAVTGSYGKTMVKNLLQDLLKTTYSSGHSPDSFNSQIGVPLSIFSLSKKHEIAILEAAVTEKDEMDRLAKMIKPDFCIMTRLGKKPSASLSDLSILTDELFKLPLQSDRLRWSLLPSFSENPSSMDSLTGSKHFWSRQEEGLPHAKSISEGRELSIPYQIQFPSSYCYQDLITSGFYYYLDLINICVKSAWKLGVGQESICKVLASYQLEPTRTEIWKSPAGVTFINDTYSEDPVSIDKAFHFLNQTTGKGRKIFLFGGLRGSPEDGDYQRVGKLLAGHKIDTLYLIGDRPWPALTGTLTQENPSTSIIRTNSYKEALELFKTSMHKEDIVLIKGERKEPFDTLMEHFHESICTNICLINLALIEHNIQSIRKKLPEKTRIMVMVKALAYGTDDFRVAKFLNTCGVDILGVSYVEEGVSLKKGGVAQSIFVLHAAEYEIVKVVAWDLEVGVSDIKMIDKLAVEAKIKNKKVKVHLHIDTGMGRFGCRPEFALDLAKQIAKHHSLILEGIMTHFSCSDDPVQDSFTHEQAKKLEDVICLLKEQGIKAPWHHASNSGAALRFPELPFNMVRIGLAVYGLHSSGAVRESHELRLAISLISRIAGINECKKGDTISYGRTYRVETESQKIAVIPIGYFDGLHRNYSGSCHVVIRGKKAPMIGNICMDFMMVDATRIENAASGDPVLIFGADEHGDYLSPEDLAMKGNSIVHELITCLGPRIQRVFIYEETANVGKQS
jgi:Alr-MurF fusion protein